MAGYPAGNQIQNLAVALLSEPVQQQIEASSYPFHRINLGVPTVRAEIALSNNVVHLSVA